MRRRPRSREPVSASRCPIPLAFSICRQRVRLRILRGDVAGGLAELLDAGRRFDSVGSHNPAFIAWRSPAALALLALGRRDEAGELADGELELARTWALPGRSGSRCARRAWSRAAREASPASTRPCRSSAGRRPSSSTQGAHRAGSGPASPQPPPCRARGAPARGRARDGLRRRDACGPRRDRASRHRRPASARRPERRRVADAERAARRRYGRRRADQPGDRPGAVRDPADRRGPPDEHLPEARDQLAVAARSRPRPRLAVGQQNTVDHLGGVVTMMRAPAVLAHHRRPARAETLEVSEMTATTAQPSVPRHPARQAHPRPAVRGRVPRLRGRVDRQRRASVDTPRPAFLRPGPAVGPECLPAHLRRLHAARRPRRRPARPPPRPRRRDIADRRLVADRRASPRARACWSALASRRAGRRDDAPGRALDPDHDASRRAATATRRSASGAPSAGWRPPPACCWAAC